jgi:hypothetical protein
MNLSAAGCPNAEVEAGSLVGSGTVAFNADQTYALSLTQTGTVKVKVPAACLTQSGITLTCDQAAQLLQASGGADSGIKSVTCTGTNGCSCTFGVSLTNPQSGTWTAANDTLTFNATGGATAADGYCVQGRELHMMNVDQTMTMGTMGQAKITSDIVAVKQ